MFEIRLKPEAVRQLKSLTPYHAARVISGIEKHLSVNPERPSRSRIKKLRGAQDATYRLRVHDYRVFYDVGEETVDIVAILHKKETGTFYTED